jgi:hypothetical protein
LLAYVVVHVFGPFSGFASSEVIAIVLLPHFHELFSLLLVDTCGFGWSELTGHVA